MDLIFQQAPLQAGRKAPRRRRPFRPSLYLINGCSSGDSGQLLPRRMAFVLRIRPLLAVVIACERQSSRSFPINVFCLYRQRFEDPSGVRCAAGVLIVIMFGRYHPFPRQQVGA